MKATFELILPSHGYEAVEQELVHQFQELVAASKAILATYKGQGYEVPVISIKIPSKFKETKDKTERQKFVQELWEYHVERVPTAHGGKQRAVLQWLYEAGHTDAEKLKLIYQERLLTYPDTSWFTVKWCLGKGAEISAASSTDTEFQRAELSDEAKEALKERLKNSVGT